MKNLQWTTLLSAIVLVVIMSACIDEDPSDSRSGTEAGTVVLKGFNIELFQTGGGANARILGEESTWEHVFKESATIEIEHKGDGSKYSLEYNPNDFTEAYQITLPIGDYVFSSVVEGGDFEPFLPYEASGEFTLGEAGTDIVLEATTDYGLVTLKNQYVDSSVISTGGGTPVDLPLNEDGSYRFIYAKGGSPAKLTIVESFSGTTIERDLNIVSSNHLNFILELSSGDAKFIELVIGAFSYEEEVILIGSAPDEPVLEIGAEFQGGKIAYILQEGDPGYVAGEVHGLIAAPSDLGLAPWGCSGTTIGTGNAIGTGAANTAAIVDGCATSGIAARLANELVIDEYDDWYLPSSDELAKLFVNRVAIGGFEDVFYWSSSQSNAERARERFFGSDFTATESKDVLRTVRAVRSF